MRQFSKFSHFPELQVFVAEIYRAQYEALAHQYGSLKIVQGGQASGTYFGNLHDRLSVQCKPAFVSALFLML